MSNEITLMESKVKSVSSTLSHTPFFPVSNFDFTMGGSATSKKVDKYANGTATGKFLDLKLTGTLKCTFLPISSPDLPVGISGVTLHVTGTLGELSGSASINGTYDESKVSPGFISGNLTAIIGNSGVSITAQWGTDLCNVSATAGGYISKTTLSGDITFVNKQLILQPKLTVSPITFNLKVSTKIGTIQFTCFDKDLPCSVNIPSLPTFSPITLYTNN